MISQAAEAAGQALAAGNLAAALAAMDEAHQQAQARRVLRAAAAGKRGQAARPGGLRELVEQHLRGYPGKQFTPHQIGKALGRSSGAVANSLGKLVSLAVAELAAEKPRSYRLAPVAPAPASGGGDGGEPLEGAA